MKSKIVMVCLGNICRSPLAEGILQSKLNNDIFEISSCGTGDYHIGKAPDSRSIKVAKENHIDISTQKAAQFKKEYFETFDLIYVMDQENYKNVVTLATTEAHKNKVHLLLDALDEPNLKEVPDPYYGGEQGFSYVFEIIDRACTVIAKNLQATQ